jgi:hypothetical protein
MFRGMKPLVASLLRHVATWIAGLTAIIVALPFMSPEDGPEVARHFDTIGVGVVGLLAVMLTRALPWLISMARAKFSKSLRDDGMNGGSGTGPSGSVLLFLLGAGFLTLERAGAHDEEFREPGLPDAGKALSLTHTTKRDADPDLVMVEGKPSLVSRGTSEAGGEGRPRFLRGMQTGGGQV